MMSVEAKCLNEDIAAYLDGELDSERRTSFETHLKLCAVCAEELREQQRFLCELSFALTDNPPPALPGNFAEVVAVNAHSDMRGVRSGIERVRAVKLCALLLVTALVVMGATARDFIFGFIRPVLTVGNFVWDTLFSLGSGFVIIVRSIGSYVFLRSNSSGLLSLFLFASALMLLPALIRRYHRANS